MCSSDLPNRTKVERRPRTPQNQSLEKMTQRNSAGSKSSREQTPEKILNKRSSRDSSQENSLSRNSLTESVTNNKNLAKNNSNEIIKIEEKKLQKQNNDFFTRNEKPDIVPNENRNQVFPRPIKFVPRKPEILRRDSANYSQASSQDNSSNDSTDQQTNLCSNV